MPMIFFFALAPAAQGARFRFGRMWAAWSLGLALLGCTSKLPGDAAAAAAPALAPVAPTEPVSATGVVGPVPATQGSPRVSAATTPRAYRQDGATHLYGLNNERIFKGKMPPLLYAIGVLQIDIDGAGRVVALRWMRAPRHAPEVIKEIERTVRAAAPFPAPQRLGQVTYTDTWLWHKSDKFQLDTLTEGQL